MAAVAAADRATASVIAMVTTRSCPEGRTPIHGSYLSAFRIGSFSNLRHLRNLRTGSESAARFDFRAGCD
jgi:hypothetical protein